MAEKLVNKMGKSVKDRTRFKTLVKSSGTNIK